MKSNRRKTPDDYLALASRRGFRWLGPEVSTTKTLTTWECPKGHHWQAIYNNIQQGRDCPHCSRRKISADYHLLAYQNNYSWVGPPVTGIDKKTGWKCNRDHEWQASFRNLLRGDSCPVCSIEIPQEISSHIDTEELPEEPIIIIEQDPDFDEITNSLEGIRLPLLLDWWGKNSLSFLKPFFEVTKSIIRVSTGFFSVQGYALFKSSLKGKHLHILVGYDERSKYDVRITLVEEIMVDLSKWHGNRRATVIHLIEKLERAELRIIDARTLKKDHSKVYIFDSNYVIGGSTNLTKTGLLLNHEADIAISSEEFSDRVNWWINQYEQYWNAPDTLDISQMLLERLKRWLGLSKPWDIYLKTIHILAPEDNPVAPRESYKTPVEFQMVVINRAIRHLNDWCGAMIVASTGLGKTVMATHIAYELLHNQKRIMNVMVIAPKSVKGEWRKRLNSAGIPGDIHTRNILDVNIDETKHQKALGELLETLGEIDDKWLIIIDESQHFKNRERSIGGERLSFLRLIDTVNEKGCLVLLLTATPYATEVDNINHQLLLLPHTCPKKQLHQSPVPGFSQDRTYLKAWKVNRVEELVDLPVGTVINAPYVAQNFAIKSDEGDYLMFGETKKYIPRIQVNKIGVPVILEEQVSAALDSGYFKHKLIGFPSRGKMRYSQASIENEVIVSWGSSPWALRDVIEKTIKPVDGYNVPFIFSLDERQQYLSPILDALQELNYSDDYKLQQLLLLLQQLRRNGHKVLIFSERLVTASYLETALAELMPNLRVANTVKQNGNIYTQKEFKEVTDLIIGFAPRSNPRENGPIPEDKYDVLITTDAFNEGINLQDASAVIHYDISWTPDTIIQRAGRILRFWHQPRMIYLYLFSGNFQNNITRRKESLRLLNRLEKLLLRTKEAEKFTEIPIIPEESQQFDTLRGLSTLFIEVIGHISVGSLEDERFEVSPFLTHLTVYKKNMKYAKTILDDVTSALTVKRLRKPQLYVLIRYQKRYHWMVYDIGKNRIERIVEDVLLDRIKCSEDTPPALIDPNEIEEYRKKCITLWCQRNRIDEHERSEVKHICSLYLSPDEKTVQELLEA